ncbi:unnamed protein product [Ambrosiozyma monospora]|uniref:Unnamed protein product n=1 Tax=Ambrosiozyma monospora TaxID=43982 RepID=A0A9W6WEH6_AMBMO|nr:unnamed protein product [Ambrosiozyma monospora]
MSISDIFASGGPGSSTNLAGLNNDNSNNNSNYSHSGSVSGGGLSFKASGSGSGSSHSHHHAETSIPNSAGAVGDDDDVASIDSFDSMDAADELGDNHNAGVDNKLVKEKSKVGESYDAVLRQIVRTASGRLKNFD